MMIDYESTISELTARAEEAEAALKLAEEERDAKQRTLDNISATFAPLREKENWTDYDDKSEWERVAAPIVEELTRSIPPVADGEMPTSEKLAQLYKQERDDLAGPAHEFWEQNRAIASLTPEAVSQAEERLDAIFGTVFQAEEPPMQDYARLKMELRRLRLAHITARKVFASLDDQKCVACGEEVVHECGCAFLAWLDKHYDTLLAHKLVSAPEKGAQE